MSSQSILHTVCQLIKHTCIISHLELNAVKLDKSFHKYVMLCICICWVHMWVKMVVSMRRYHQTCMRTNTLSKGKNSLKSCFLKDIIQTEMWILSRFQGHFWIYKDTVSWAAPPKAIYAELHMIKNWDSFMVI